MCHVPVVNKPGRWLKWLPLRKTHVHCLRQYFYAEISLYGDVIYCKPRRMLDALSPQLQKAIETGNTGAAWLVVWRAWLCLLARTHSTMCYYPCKCHPWLEPILWSFYADSPALKTSVCINRFTKADVDQALPFIRTRLNPFFRRSFFRHFLRPGE